MGRRRQDPEACSRPAGPEAGSLGEGEAIQLLLSLAAMLPNVGTAAAHTSVPENFSVRVEQRRQAIIFRLSGVVRRSDGRTTGCRL